MLSSRGVWRLASEQLRATLLGPATQKLGNARFLSFESALKAYLQANLAPYLQQCVHALLRSP
eukprot:11147710-Alexandrium_andersonii.AAC.1